MLKLVTQVDAGLLPVQICPEDRIMVLGSCFADSIGAKLQAGGFDVCVNPFGTLYNPVSVANSLARLGADASFGPEDCVEMGAGAGLICSWWHHTRFAKPTAEEFLAEANAALHSAAEFWKGCNKVLITLGTAMVWKLAGSGEVVSNCLKRPAAEFSHEMLGVAQTAAILERMVAANPGKEFIFTVSPIRHLGEGAHRNTLSKSTLHLALQEIADRVGNDVGYFPAYEIVLDELRDYRFYADDLVHPSATAVELIWQRFLDAAVPARWHEQIRAAEKASRIASHRSIH
ncbi:MAG: GSCFA domain-containing protein [Bacteroidales bacterium]|nr:GSCFA domain-containing protein [Bacteroidales bacterium]